MFERSARWSGVLVLALVVLVGAACTGSSSDSQPTTTATTSPAGRAASTTRLARFANTLTSFVGSPDGTEMLVGDRLGAIWRMRSSGAPGELPALDPRPALDLTGRVSAAPGERGFFAMALTPDGRSLVVDFTSKDGAITVLQFPYEPGRDPDPTAARTLLDLPDPYGWHHGGGLAFDADGDLFVGIGDMEFRQVDPPGAQDPTLMLGGILRIPASVVGDRSAPSEPGPGDMVARGLRNPWRISIDPTSGGLWIGDVGLDTFEEINLIAAADLDGGTVTNFGWPYREGSSDQQGTAPAGTELVDPVLARRHREGVCGMVGGYRYRGTRVRALRGRYVYGDLCGTNLRALTTSGTDVTADHVVADLSETIVSLGEDASGELYLLGASGGFYRLDPVGSVNRSSDQHPPVQETTTTIARSRPNCDGGIVAAVKPLTDIAAMSGPEAEAALAKANARLDELVPTVPDYLHDDAVIVQRAMRALAEAVTAAEDGSTSSLESLRADLLAGRNQFAGFPDAMASVVDSECG